ncbi:hypothetical protein [Dactylosporangium sp. CA-139066]|uniref:hypothetical protein n=1 Tax=Dactylosporangium sp. CA-139066 TaxID=3239930 RepID=UPI003D8EFF31
MTSGSGGVGGETRQGRPGHRETWLPLLVLGVVALWAIPVYRPVVDGCGPACRAVQFCWWAGLVLGYVVIARACRGRGFRLLPYVLGGVAFAALSVTVVASARGLGGPSQADDRAAFVPYLVRVLDPTGVIGLALLALAWLERRAAMLLFALGFLAVALVPFDLGSALLVVSGGVLLLGSAGFAVAQRLRARWADDARTAGVASPGGRRTSGADRAAGR